MSKLIENEAKAKAESQERLALEDFAIRCKNKGIKEIIGENFTLSFN